MRLSPVAMASQTETMNCHMQWMNCEIEGTCWLSFSPEHSPLPSLLFNHVTELREQQRGIVRAGRGLGMVLHAEDRLGLVAHAFDCLIVEIDSIN